MGTETTRPTDAAVRVAEIRQENRGGVSANDIDWLCRIVDAAQTYLAYGDPGPGYDERTARHLRRSLRKAVYGG